MATAKRAKKTASTASGKKASVPRPKSTASPSAAVWTFPKHSLEDAIAIPKAIEEQNAGNPMKADELVKAVGFTKSTDWRFLDLLRSAGHYGLTEGSGAAATVRLDLIGQNVVAPSSAQDRQQALVNAFRNVELFRNVEEYYKGKKLPEDEFFENTLVREFQIPRDRVRVFIDIFTKNLNYLRAFRGEPTTEQETSGALILSKAEPKPDVVHDADRRPRSFLDTCFVMMPFGEWYDQYYKEIYISAIQEAGMEAVRADELFSTGSVIEQIWEQIEKAKILLADLSNKNANVFYELGLAHAARKPVVFTAGSLDDVPFDLRHLRVVIYDNRDPFWGDKLKKSLTAYLKAAKSDPAKSVPQPFRALLNPADES